MGQRPSTIGGGTEKRRNMNPFQWLKNHLETLAFTSKEQQRRLKIIRRWEDEKLRSDEFWRLAELKRHRREQKLKKD